MPRITLNKINEALKNEFDLFEIELVKGKGYFYFIGDTDGWMETSVYTYYLSDFSIEQWVEEAVRLSENKF